MEYLVKVCLGLAAMLCGVLIYFYFRDQQRQDRIAQHNAAVWSDWQQRQRDHALRQMQAPGMKSDRKKVS